MVVARTAQGRGRGARVRLNIQLFDRLTSGLGADTDIQRAELVGVDRATISRLRHRKFTASLEVAMRMADKLGTTVDELFEVAS